MQVMSVPVDVELDEATLIAGVLRGNQAAPGAEEVLSATDATLLESAGFEGKAGQVLVVPYRGGAALLAGLGEEAGFETIRAAMGNAVREVRTRRAVTNLCLLPVEGAARAVVEGAVLGGYRFGRYKTEDRGEGVETVELIGADSHAVAEAVVGADATNLARDWGNIPARDKSPAVLAGLIAEAALGAGVEAETWDEARIAEERLDALRGVAAGSDRPPRLVVLSYRPPAPVTHLGLVGKGVVFDSGGLSLKTAALMEQMKTDMAGAATVAAATIAVSRLGLPLAVTAVAPLTDNAVGGDATRPGDVLRPVDGPTVEVLNTDAEGRLILADGLGVVRGYRPDLIVDVATLTGASRVALGDKIGAVIGSDPDLVSSLLDAASRAGEQFWELPLFGEYRKSLESDVADLKNVSGNRYGGAIVAALFLSAYAGEGPWAHLDIAGPARWPETAGEQVKGASGVGVRTLVELARDLATAP